jgi:hypothetical protein
MRRLPISFSMPKVAVDTGCVDFVLALEDIALPGKSGDAGTRI